MFFSCSPVYHGRQGVPVSLRQTARLQENVHYVGEEAVMAKPLDGIEFLAYCHRLHFPKETQELLMSIRSSPPNRTPGARHGNMPVWYPSKKMQCIIKAESTKVEFPFLLQAEHDQEILEVWDHPPSIPLEYL